MRLTHVQFAVIAFSLQRRLPTDQIRFRADFRADFRSRLSNRA